jgi:hypothetical protein
MNFGHKLTQYYVQRPSTTSGNTTATTLHAAALNDWVYEIKDMITQEAPDVEAKDKVHLLL